MEVVNIMANYAVNLFGNICELFITIFFFNGKYDIKIKKSLFVPICILLTIFQFLNTNLFLAKSSFVILGSILFIFLISFLFSAPLIFKFLFSISIYLILAFSEVIIGMIITSLLGLDIAYTQSNLILFAICTIISKFLSYIFVLMTVKRKFALEFKGENRNIFWIYLMPIASLIIMVNSLKCCYIIDELGFRISTLISSVILAFANIAVFYVIDKLNELIEVKEKLLFAEKHINNQVAHYQELSKYQNELKVFRHDIKNRLLILMGLIEEGRSDKALQTMKSELDLLEEINCQIINSGNPIVDAILQAKFHRANEKNITLQISTRLAEEIRIDELELGIVLGNALDNAVEAVEKNSDGNKKHIKLMMASTDGRISISVTNPVEKNINTDVMITSKPDKDNHGYGIKSIKAIAEKHDGIVSLSCDNVIFNININMANE